MIYEVNFYPTEAGDGIFIPCKTKTQALKEYAKLQRKYPNRTGDAFIKVWKNYDTCYAEVITNIEIWLIPQK